MTTKDLPPPIPAIQATDKICSICGVDLTECQPKDAVLFVDRMLYVCAICIRQLKAML